MNPPFKGSHLLLWSQISGKRRERRISLKRSLIPHAVERNRWRRRIREVLRKHQNSLWPERDIHFKVHRVGTGEIRFEDLEREMVTLLTEAGIFR